MTTKIIRVQVKPNSSKVSILEDIDTLIIKLTSKPINNEANEELVKVLKKYFNTNFVKIVKGFKSKTKIVEISID